MREDRPSSTALLIARSTLLAAHDAHLKALIPPEAIAPLRAMLAAAGGGRALDFALRHAWSRALLRQAERAVLPGIVAHYLARKQWLERCATEALVAGCRQLVVLGAGCDTLAWRLHDHWPQAHFWELDHPATQRLKTMSLAPAANVSLLPADLGRTSPSVALKAAGAFDFTQPVCFVAEGLLMYFRVERVRALLADIAQQAGAVVAFSFMAPGPDGRAAFRGGSPAIGAWLRLRQEPFQWAIAPAELPEFLRSLGLRLERVAGAPELRAEILAPLGLASTVLAEGEHLCLATASR